MYMQATNQIKHTSEFLSLFSVIPESTFVLQFYRGSYQKNHFLTLVAYNRYVFYLNIHMHSIFPDG